jgi:hypothetical protein
LKIWKKTLKMYRVNLKPRNSAEGIINDTPRSIPKHILLQDQTF